MIKFGPAGHSASFASDGKKHTYEMPEWLKSKGLDVFEYSFGRGVNIKEDTAKIIGEEAQKHGIEMTAHAPYYINFATNEQIKAENNVRYVMNSLNILSCFGGKRLVIHTAAQAKLERREALLNASRALESLSETVLSAGYNDYLLCLETMGKKSQIGTVDEIVEFCKISPIYIPTLDFGHINACFQGILKTKDDYRREIDKVFNGLGEEKAKKIHMHFSKIQYSQAGEVRHLTFDDNIYGPEFSPLAEILLEYGMEPCVICESAGTQAEDALIMKREFINMRDNSLQK